MRIVLVRHGKLKAVAKATISGRSIGQWFRDYDAASISRDLAPPAALRELATSVRCVVASDRARARESAAWLASSRDIRVDAELREAALPESLGLSLRLPPSAWTILARAAWWLDWCESEETIAATRERAHRVADRLTALAAEHDSVMAVGHGIFNWFVARQLRRRGWQGAGFVPLAYWSFAQFERWR